MAYYGTESLTPKPLSPMAGSLVDVLSRIRRPRFQRGVGQVGIGGSDRMFRPIQPIDPGFSQMPNMTRPYPADMFPPVVSAGRSDRMFRPAGAAERIIDPGFSTRPRKRAPRGSRISQLALDSMAENMPGLGG